MVSLLSKSLRNFNMLVILDCDDDSVGKSFPNCTDRLSRRNDQFLPCVEDQGFINIMN